MASPAVSLSPSSRLVGKYVYARGATSGKAVSAFLGIPYAEPPVGNLRFQRPQPLTQLWHGDKQATEFGAICYQNSHVVSRTYSPFPFPSVMSEDCLYLNVWTPCQDKDAKLPVMVWFYGGAFIHGFSNYYDGTAFASRHNVVYVSLNYRVGAFGFMSTEDDTIPGNMGLLDQVEALKWIQQHIHHFGGDPDNVTLFGESAGGISTSMHIVSPLSKGLFRRAISQSGVSIHPSAAWPRRNAMKYLTTRLKRAGLSVNHAKQIPALFSCKSGDEIVRLMGDGFNPVMDGYFLPEDPNKLYSKGLFHDVDFMVGCTSHEGAFFIFDLAKTKSIESAQKARSLVDMVIKKMFFRGHPRADELSQAVYNHYIGSGKNLGPQELTSRLVDMYGDLLFMVPSINTAKMHSKRCATYFYRYSHRRILSSHPDWVGADHGDEIPYVTGEPFLTRMPDVWSKEEKDVSDMVMTYWANFARTGDPNGGGLPHWPKFEAESQEYLDIQAMPSQLNQPIPDRVHFWTNTVPNLLKNITQSKY